ADDVAFQDELEAADLESVLDLVIASAAGILAKIGDVAELEVDLRLEQKRIAGADEKSVVIARAHVRAVGQQLRATVRILQHRAEIPASAESPARTARIRPPSIA